MTFPDSQRPPAPFSEYFPLEQPLFEGFNIVTFLGVHMISGLLVSISVTLPLDNISAPFLDPVVLRD